MIYTFSGVYTAHDIDTYASESVPHVNEYSNGDKILQQQYRRNTMFPYGADYGRLFSNRGLEIMHSSETGQTK